MTRFGTGPAGTLVLLAALLIPPQTLFGAEGGVVHVDRALCETGPLHAYGGTPFSLLLFCEDALGNDLAVVYGAPLGRPSVGPWSLMDRVWQGGPWSRDVTSYVGSDDGRTLFVATSEVYGTGGVYRLDLIARRAVRLDPETDPAPKGRIYEIEALRDGRLEFSVALDGVTERHSVRTRRGMAP